MDKEDQPIHIKKKNREAIYVGPGVSGDYLLIPDRKEQQKDQSTAFLRNQQPTFAVDYDPQWETILQFMEF